MAPSPPATTQMACLECDLLVSVAPLVEGQRADCPRCGHTITAPRGDWRERALSFSVAALVLLAMANAFPFLSLIAGGLESVMTLPKSAVELYQDGYWTIAVLVLGPIVGIPALILLVLLAVVVPLHGGRSRPWLVPGARLLALLNPWAMVEVFVIGVLVSLVKIGAMAKVVLGLSFFAYVGFALCFIAAIASLDRAQLWREIHEVTS